MPIIIEKKPPYGSAFLIRWIILVLAVTFLFCVRVEADSGISRIKKNKELTAALPGRDFYPYHYRSLRGRLTGVDVDLARDIAGRLGVKLKIDAGAASGQEALDKVFRGEADLALGGLRILFSEARRVSFTRPYLVLDHALLVNRLDLAALNPAGSIVGLIKACCARIGVLNRPPDAEKAAGVFPRARIIVYEDPDRLVHDVLKGRLLALFCDEIQAGSILAGDPSLAIRLKLAPVPGSGESLGLALAWPDRRFKAWLDLYFTQVRTKDSPDLIRKRYPLTLREQP